MLIAYLAGGSAIIVSILPVAVPYLLVLVVFFLVLSIFTLTGVNVVRKYNFLLILFLWVAFAFLVIMAEAKVQPERLKYVDWLFLPATVPIIVTAFHFHNIIPTVCHTLNWKRKTIIVVMLLGVIVGFVINTLWVEVGIGVLPMEEGPDSLLQAFLQELPATIPLSHVIHTRSFVALALLFALLAIMTSYLANGLGLVDFIVDLNRNHLGIKNRTIDALFTFGPPLIIAGFSPISFSKP